MMCDMNKYGNGGNNYVYEIANWKMQVVQFLMTKSPELEIDCNASFTDNLDI